MWYVPAALAGVDCGCCAVLNRVVLRCPNPYPATHQRIRRVNSTGCASPVLLPYSVEGVLEIRVNDVGAVVLWRRFTG